MDLQFDHLIHYMNDPTYGMGRLNEKGIHTVQGGFHEKRGTYNTLSYFGLKYIELLGINDKELFDHVGAAHIQYSPFEEIARNHFREGFAKINMRTTNLKKLANHLENHGIKTNGPISLSRRKPDGKLLEWELLYAGGHSGELPLPFFIDWKEDDAARCHALKEDGTIAAHPAGALELASIHFAVTNANKTSTLWKRLFDLEAGSTYIDQELLAECYPLKLKDVTFIFTQPLIGVTSALRKALTEKGEHPYLLTLKGVEKNDSFSFYGGNYKLISPKLENL